MTKAAPCGRAGQKRHRELAHVRVEEPASCHPKGMRWPGGERPVTMGEAARGHRERSIPRAFIDGWRTFAALVVLAVIAADGAGAQEWPNRPIRFIVPFPAGGSTDV